MNDYLYKRNLYKNGVWQPDNSKAWAKDRAKDISPTKAQIQYRDSLYDFIAQKGLVRDGFKLGRTKKAVTANIYAFYTILRKNGLVEEYIANQMVKGICDG